MFGTLAVVYLSSCVLIFAVLACGMAYMITRAFLEVVGGKRWSMASMLCVFRQLKPMLKILGQCFIPVVNVCLLWAMLRHGGKIMDEAKIMAKKELDKAMGQKRQGKAKGGEVDEQRGD